MRFLILSLISFLTIACTNNRRQEILIPELNAGFYSEALDNINGKLQSDPSNISLIEQKLYYCEQLNWPTTCLSALNEYKAKHGMTNQLVEEYIKYYERHQRDQLLVDVIDKWNSEYDLVGKYHKSLIESLVRIGNKQRALNELRVYLAKNQRPTDIAFAAQQYLPLRDTALAILYLSKLRKVDPSDKLMIDYGELLIDQGYPIIAFNVMEDFCAVDEVDEQNSLRIAQVYVDQGWLQDGRNKLKPFIEKDTIAYLIADWYQREFFWDSAAMYIDSVLVGDSTNTKAWWKRGRIYEERGWLSSSIKYFEKILEFAPSDSIAINRIDLIQRKIAYLQRQKFEESKVPILELEPIKIKN